MYGSKSLPVLHDILRRSKQLVLYPGCRQLKGFGAGKWWL